MADDKDPDELIPTPPEEVPPDNDENESVVPSEDAA